MEAHSHSHSVDSDSAMQGIQNEHRGHVPEFLDEMNERGEAELLEMLHMPILHGGVKEVLLLGSLTTSSAGSFTVACLVLVLCTALLELLRLFVSRIENQFFEGNSAKAPVCECKHCNSLTTNVRSMAEWKQYDAIHDTSLPEAEASTSAISRNISTKIALSRWFGVGGLQFLVYLFSTFLMLIAMTMNIYLIISMAAGSAIGKLTVICVKKKLLDSRK